MFSFFTDGVLLTILNKKYITHSDRFIPYMDIEPFTEPLANPRPPKAEFAAQSNVLKTLWLCNTLVRWYDFAHAQVINSHGEVICQVYTCRHCILCIVICNGHATGPATINASLRYSVSDSLLTHWRFSCSVGWDRSEHQSSWLLRYKVDGCFRLQRDRTMRVC